MPALARDLLDGKVFRSGELTQRLTAANLPGLEEDTLRQLGIAVAHRAMNNTFVIQFDGVEACAADTSLERWPAAYRAGVAEGLLLDRNGYVSPNVWGANHLALVMAAHPDAAAVLEQLETKVRAADWAYAYAGNPVLRTEVTSALGSSLAILSTAKAQTALTEIIGLLRDRANSGG
ncbi:hypothetical protein [Catelliglobosispora koreensis]|uniref:hypothetical protein n=1 Tax=Catelliglobosispora koreensis TaxID=129052 RepID=UPI0003676B8C|nr:hypothetical protein [Catelliglobosispora koreensis]